MEILAAIGIASALQSERLDPFKQAIGAKYRILGDLLYCYKCLSFWLTLIITLDPIKAFACYGILALVGMYYNKNL